MRRVRSLGSWIGSLIGCGILLFSFPGCEIFRDRPGLFRTANYKLPPLQAAPDAIQLEIVYAERPVGDRLLGEALWKDVDQILNLEPEAQRDLERNGFRIGVAGSHPPEALQTLLELKSDFSDVPESDLAAAKKLRGNRVFVRPGTPTEIQVSPIYPACDLTLYRSHKSETGEAKQYPNARCLYRVSAHRVQEGWARLEFVPEIQYGNAAMRPNPGPQDWELVNSQQVEKLHAQRFNVMLNVGEMALVTARDNLPGTVGHRFFVGPDGADDVQRLLLVRLVHIGNPQPAE